MVNAFHAHNQEFDCVHELTVVHHLTTIQTAVLAYMVDRLEVFSNTNDLMQALNPVTL